uniref:Peptidase A1 domain-containing protein n=1 Tax=Heterorhabditis bacteriophora TaxID=37862 RepID=A0A1I7WE35_HETBA
MESAQLCPKLRPSKMTPPIPAFINNGFDVIFSSSCEIDVLFWQGQQPGTSVVGEDYISVGIANGKLHFSNAQDNWQQTALSALSIMRSQHQIALLPSAIFLVLYKVVFDKKEEISDSRGYYENISGPQKA